MNEFIENTVTTYSNPFISENGLNTFQKIVVSLKNKANAQGLSSTEHLLYNIIRDLPWNRGFSTPQQDHTEGFKQALSNLEYLLEYRAKDNLFKDFPTQALLTLKANIKDKK